MGSHGSATAAGQLQVLARSGITDASIGCPIRSSLDVELLGELPTGMPVAMDRCAYLVHIRNTRDLATIEISSALVAECRGREDLALVGEPFPLRYDDGALTTLRGGGQSAAE